jgi:hypothetical protein
MPLGPNRAPGLYDVPVSKGAPVMFSIRIQVLYGCHCTYESNIEALILTGEARKVW